MNFKKSLCRISPEPKTSRVVPERHTVANMEKAVVCLLAQVLPGKCKPRGNLLRLLLARSRLLLLLLLLSRCEVGNLLARLHEAAVILLLQLRSNLIQRHQRRGSVQIVFALFGDRVSALCPLANCCYWGHVSYF